MIDFRSESGNIFLGMSRITLYKRAKVRCLPELVIRVRILLYTAQYNFFCLEKKPPFT